ncbi:hypothetical protein KRR38_24430 [Novosphingobium sp. G106]|uniref:hypothetical protein n=1 Tax=Novosphingobium sp. G106 TaxID=2849500 RepID=UPI001C2DA711|nr:hypothetical protein [Novosphingobium sp. G106]MBV1690738.1 hypothetical protein [Novosphingobium sp. G106]
MNDVLGGCLPATPGAQVHFSRMALRGLLGEAAYELDLVLAAVPPRDVRRCALTFRPGYLPIDDR